MTTVVAPNGQRVAVLAATAVEARPLLRRLRDHPEVLVVRTGIGRAPAGLDSAKALLSCGLAGGLREDLPSGTMVIPDEVSASDGSVTRCSEALVQRLREAAERIAITWHPGPLVTVDHMVTGTERSTWAGLGYAAVDMESALIAARGRPFAAVRVVLDTPRHELSSAWARPKRALLTPRLWGEATWLARVAPRQCDLVASVVATAFDGVEPGGYLGGSDRA